MTDDVNHPAHYTQGPIHDACGAPIECIDVTEGQNFNLGNAIKYIWRCDDKGDTIKDLKKALWYIQREVSRRQLALDRINGDGEDDDVKPAVDATTRGWTPQMHEIAKKLAGASGFKDVGHLSSESAKAVAAGTHLHGSVFVAPKRGRVDLTKASDIAKMYGGNVDDGSDCAAWSRIQSVPVGNAQVTEDKDGITVTGTIPEPVASLIFGGMTTGLSIGPFSAPPARQDAQDSVDRFLTNYTGDACPGCGTSYQDCTRARLTQSSMTIVPGGACCMTCSDGDSHHEREAADRYDAMTKPATQAVPDTVEPRPTTSTDLHTGYACEECGTTYTICSARVKVGQGNCCTHCAFTDAHSVQAIPAVPFPKVHNHGPEDGPGLSCPEATVDGQLRGACLDHIIVRTKPGFRCSCWTWAVPAPCTTSTALISFREHLRGVGAL